MKRFIAVALLAAGAVCSAPAQADLQPLATVKITQPESVTLRQLKNRVSAYQKQRGAPFTLDEKKEILDALVNERLVVQAAQQTGVAVTDTQVNMQFVQGVSQQMGRPVTEQEFAAYITQNMGQSLDEYMSAQTGMNAAEYKQFLKNQMIAQQYIISGKRDELQQTAPTDKEIRDYYAIHQAELVQSETLRLFLVIIRKGSDATASRKRITDMFGEAKQGKTKLDELKKRFSGDADLHAGDIFVNRTPQSAQQLGISPEALGELFAKDKGFVSELIETPTDFQFYVVRERYPAKLLAISDVVQPESTVIVYEFIRSQLEQEKQARFLTDAVKDATAKLRTPANFQMLKTGAALDALLNW